MSMQTKEGQSESEGKEQEIEIGHVHGPHCNHGHHHQALRPLTREAPKVGRNDPCPCGSGKKFKKCCGNS